MKTKVIPKGLEGWLSKLKNAARKGLNTAGEYYDDFSKTMNTPRRVPITGTGIGFIPNMATMNRKNEKPTLQYYTTTPKQELMRTATVMSLPFMVANPVATINGMVGGMATGYVGSKVGRKVAKAVGANEKALEMAGDIGGFIGGIPGAKAGASNPFSYVIDDVVKKNGYNLNNFKFLLDKRFYSDLLHGGVKSARLLGNYPLTTSERRSWISGFKDDVKKGIRFTRDDALNNQKLIGTTKENADKFIDWYKKPDDLMDNAEWFDRFYFDRKLENEGASTWRINNLGRAEETALFGTRKSINTYSPDKSMYPSDNSYQAFANNGNIYFPFRTHKNSLHTHKWMNTPSKRAHTGAHEYEHTVQDMHDTPLVRHTPKKEGEYGMYTNEDLDLALKTEVNDMIDRAGTAGKWEGSLEEMDSELKGWRAQFDYPRFTEMTPLLLQHIVNLANSRFGVSPRVSTPRVSRSNRSLNSNSNKPSYRKPTLEEQPFYNVYRYLEAAGFKQGGKLKYFKQ